MSVLARIMDGHPTPGEICAAYRPSVALYRLRNTPDPEDYVEGEPCCRSCGGQSLEVIARETPATYGSYSGDSPAETVFAFLCHLCGDVELDDGTERFDNIHEPNTPTGG